MKSILTLCAIGMLLIATSAMSLSHYVGAGVHQTGMSFKGDHGRDRYKHNLTGAHVYYGVSFNSFGVEFGGSHDKWSKNGFHKHRTSSHFLNGLWYVLEAGPLHPFVGAGVCHAKLDYVITKDEKIKISVRKAMPRALAGFEYDLGDALGLRVSVAATPTRSLKHTLYLPSSSTSIHGGLIYRL